jgi:hypothetical protein
VQEQKFDNFDTAHCRRQAVCKMESPYAARLSLLLQALQRAHVIGAHCRSYTSENLIWYHFLYKNLYSGECQDFGSYIQRGVQEVAVAHGWPSDMSSALSILRGGTRSCANELYFCQLFCCDWENINALDDPFILFRDTYLKSQPCLPIA